MKQCLEKEKYGFLVAVGVSMIQTNIVIKVSKVYRVKSFQKMFPSSILPLTYMLVQTLVAVGVSIIQTNMAIKASYKVNGVKSFLNISPSSIKKSSAPSKV